MAQLNVTLSDELSDFVEAKAREDHSSAEAYVAGLVEREKARQILREKVLEGMNDTSAIPADDAYFDALRARAGSVD